MASGASSAGSDPGAPAVEHADHAGVAGDAAEVKRQPEIMNALNSLNPSLDNKIGDMKAKAKALKLEKKRVAKDLRNAEKRRKRLRARCNELPAEDLLEVLAMRRVGDEEAARAAESGEQD